MGLDHQMEDLTLAREKLQEIVDRFDNIVVTERLFESLVLIAQRELFCFTGGTNGQVKNTGPKILIGNIDRKF